MYRLFTYVVVWTCSLVRNMYIIYNVIINPNEQRMIKEDLQTYPPSLSLSSDLQIHAAHEFPAAESAGSC